MDKVMLIKERRDALGLTQRELGMRMGVDCSTVTKWETEVALPKARQIPLLAEVLGVPIGDLFVSQPRDCKNDNTFEGA